MYHYALHNTKNSVTIYKPLDILNAKPFETVEAEPISRETLFNWENREDIFVDKDTSKIKLSQKIKMSESVITLRQKDEL